MEPEPGSLGDLLREDHIHMVWRAFRRRLGHAELAWDATGMLFERVSKRFERFDPRRGSFEGWLLSFVEFVAREVWRSEHRHLPLEAIDAQAGVRGGNDIPPEPFSDLPRDLRIEIEALTRRDRAILVLKAEGWPSIAIADLLGMTPTNVTTRLSRIRDRLARRLELPDVA